MAHDQGALSRSTTPGDGQRSRTMARYLITAVPQADGGNRELYARTAADAAAAKRALRRDRATVECIGPAEYVDVERDGARRRYVLDGAE